MTEVKNQIQWTHTQLTSCQLPADEIDNIMHSSLVLIASGVELSMRKNLIPERDCGIAEKAATFLVRTTSSFLQAFAV